MIDPEADRQFALSSTPYSTLVAGIYSTKPGVTGSLHSSEDPKLQDEIPMAIIGIVPCKVSAENAIIGKAMQPWSKGKGKIDALITLR